MAVPAAFDAESVARKILGMFDWPNAQALVHWNGVSDRHTRLARAVEVMVGAAPSSLMQHIQTDDVVQDWTAVGHIYALLSAPEIPFAAETTAGMRL